MERFIPEPVLFETKTLQVVLCLKGLNLPSDLPSQVETAQDPPQLHTSA